MALPTIPTSFSPTLGKRQRSDLGGVFSFISYFVLGIALLLAVGVFSYEQLLAKNLSSQDAALAKVESSIDPATVEDFVQLRNRLDSSKTLLANHLSLSNFFYVLETVLPQTVRFSKLDITIDATGSVAVNGTGVSKSFNALSFASASFATDGRIKNVIFSKMSINKDGSVTFNFSATIDPKLLAFSPDAQTMTPAIQAPVVSTTTSNQASPSNTL